MTFVLFWFVLFCFVLFCFVLFCFVLLNCTFIYLKYSSVILLVLSRHTKTIPYNIFIIRYHSFHFIFFFFIYTTQYTTYIYLFFLFFFICCRCCCCCWYRWCIFLRPLTFFTHLCFFFLTKIITDIKNFT